MSECYFCGDSTRGTICGSCADIAYSLEGQEKLRELFEKIKWGETTPPENPQSKESNMTAEQVAMAMGREGLLHFDEENGYLWEATPFCVIQRALMLIAKQGHTTTLEVKESLRSDHYWVSQKFVSGVLESYDRHGFLSHFYDARGYHIYGGPTFASDTLEAEGEDTEDTEDTEDIEESMQIDDSPIVDLRARRLASIFCATCFDLLPDGGCHFHGTPPSESTPENFVVLDLTEVSRVEDLSPEAIARRVLDSRR